MTRIDTQSIESSAYRASFSDGLLDAFAGAGLVWMGASWLWIEPIGAIAGVLPAALVPAVLVIRKRIVESRTGYVRWMPERREWERREQRGLLATGAALLILGLALVGYRALGGEVPEVGTLVAGLPAILIALPLLILAATTGLARLWGYFLVFLGAAAITAVLDANPGAGLLAGGIVVLLTGISMVARFFRTRVPDGAA